MMTLAFIAGMPGIGEVLIIVAVLALLFGAKKIPQIAHSFGKSLSEFKRGRKEGEKLVKEIEMEIKQVGIEVKKETKND